MRRRKGGRLARPAWVWRLLVLALLASSAAQAQEISLKMGGEPAHLAAGHAIIVDGVQYVGRDSGKCKLWISDQGSFRSSGCDLIPDNRPLSERLADTWEERPLVIVAVPVAFLVLVIGSIVTVARRKARRAGERPGSPAAT